MKRVLLLFDVDGTLLRTNGAGMRAMLRVAARLFGEQWKWDGIKTAGHLDPLIFAEAALLNGLDDDPTHHERFRDHYLEELDVQLQENRRSVAAMPGIVAAIGALRKRAQRRDDVVVGMLTGNYTRAVPIKLQAVGIEPDWFTVTAFGDEAKTRADLVALAMRKYEARFGVTIEPDRVIVIGDTPRDVACAHAHGCIAFTVATGGAQAHELHAAGADHVVDDLSDPAPLFNLIDQKLAE